MQQAIGEPMATILIIDDDASILNLLDKFLTRQNHEVILAEDGGQGLQKVLEAPPDLIITDIMMPGMDGLEFLLTLQKKSLNIPIIAISGGTRGLPINFLQQAKYFGAWQVMEKPFTLIGMDRAVKAALAGL